MASVGSRGGRRPSSRRKNRAVKFAEGPARRDRPYRTCVLIETAILNRVSTPGFVPTKGRFEPPKLADDLHARGFGVENLPRKSPSARQTSLQG